MLADESKASVLGAGARSVGRAVGPIAAGAAAAEAAGMVGLAGGPLVAGGAAILAGLGTGLGTAWAQRKAAERGLAPSFMKPESEERDVRDQPIASFVGGTLPMALAGRPNVPRTIAALKQAGISAGLQGGIEAGSELAGHQPLSAKRIALATGTGALFSGKSPTKSAIEAVMGRGRTPRAIKPGSFEEAARAHAESKAQPVQPPEPTAPATKPDKVPIPKRTATAMLAQMGPEAQAKVAELVAARGPRGRVTFGDIRQAHDWAEAQGVSKAAKAKAAQAAAVTQPVSRGTAQPEIERPIPTVSVTESVDPVVARVRTLVARRKTQPPPAKALDPAAVGDVFSDIEGIGKPVEPPTRPQIAPTSEPQAASEPAVAAPEMAPNQSLASQHMSAVEDDFHQAFIQDWKRKYSDIPGPIADREALSDSRRAWEILTYSLDHGYSMPRLGDLGSHARAALDAFDRVRPAYRSARVELDALIEDSMRSQAASRRPQVPSEPQVAAPTLPEPAIQEPAPAAPAIQTSAPTGEAPTRPPTTELSYPPAGDVVGSLRVRPGPVPNAQSAEGYFPSSRTLPGIREVSLADWGPHQPSYSATENARYRSLAQEIQTSGEVSPLLVGVDVHGEPFIIEGEHRLEALRLLKAKSFPARVVMETTVAPRPEPSSGSSTLFSGVPVGPMAREAAAGARAVGRGAKTAVVGRAGDHEHSWQAILTRFRNMGPAGRQVADTYEGARVEIGNKAGAAKESFLYETPVRKLSGAEDFRVSQASRGLLDPETLNPNERAVFDWWQNYKQGVPKRMADLGMKVRTDAGERVPMPEPPDPTYHPQGLPSLRDLEAGPVRRRIVHRMAAEEGRLNGEPAPTEWAAKLRAAEAEVDQFVRAIKSDERSGSLDPLIERHMQRMEAQGRPVTREQAQRAIRAMIHRSRERGTALLVNTNLDYAAEVHHPFYDPSIKTSVPHYLEGAEKRLVQVERFGQDNEKLTALVDQIPSTHTDPMKTERAREYLLRTLGQTPIEDPTLDRPLKWINTYITSKLGMVTGALNLQQIQNVILATDAKTTIQAARRAWTPNGFRRAMRSGAIDENVIHGAMFERFRMDPKSVGAKLSLIPQGEKYVLRPLANEAGILHLEKWARKIRANPQDAMAAAELKALFLDPAEVAASRGPLPEAWKMRAGKAMADRTQFTYEAGDLPDLLTKNAVLRTAGRLKPYTFQQREFLTKEFQRTARSSPARFSRAVGVLLSAGLVTGEGMSALRAEWSGRKREKPQWAMTPAGKKMPELVVRALDDLLIAGQFTVMGDFAQALGSNNISDYILGPASSIGEGLGRGARAALTGHVTQGDKRFAVRQIPGQLGQPLQYRMVKQTPEERRASQKRQYGPLFPGRRAEPDTIWGTP